MDESTSTTQTVTKTSAGSVKITIEEYNDLQARANRPQTVTYNRIEKTAEMAAKDKLVFGNIFMVAGVAQLGLGIYLRFKGQSELKAL